MIPYPSPGRLRYPEEVFVMRAFIALAKLSALLLLEMPWEE